MAVLVAGGAGFIGSHLVDRLLAEGEDVVVADKLCFGDRNIRHLLDDNELGRKGRFRFYMLELADQECVDKVFAENKIDTVYHLAANSDIRKGGEEPAVDWSDTLKTTRTILEGMRKANVRNLFFASTSAVYGERFDERLSETTGGLQPISYYGGAKLASEALISSYTYMCNLHSVVFRFPNVIGPRLTHGVIYDFMNKLKQSPHKLKILGNGTQCKPYIYVFDLIDAIAYLTKEWKSGQDVFNISVNSAGTTVTRIAEIVVEEMGLDGVQFEYTGGNCGWKGDVSRFEYDISKILATGWKPRHTSDEAVRQTVTDMIAAKM